MHRQLAAMPSPSLLRLLLARRPGLGTGERVPALRLTLAQHRPGSWEPLARVLGHTRGMPPTWPQVVAAPLHLALALDPAMPLPVAGLIHVRQELTWHSLTPPPGAWSIEVWTGEQRTARRGVELDLHTRVAVEGALLCESCATVLSRAAPGSGERAARPPEPVLVDARDQVLTLAPDTGRRYARASGDWNPIHLHPRAARLLGQPTAIAHGMYLLGAALAALGDDLPERGHMEARFVRPAPLPSRSTLLWSAQEGGWTGALEDGQGRAQLALRVEPLPAPDPSAPG